MEKETKILLGLFGIAIGIGGVKLLAGSTTKKNDTTKAPDKKKKLLFIGDSYTANFHSVSYADQLAALMPNIEYKKIAKVGQNIKWMIQNSQDEIKNGSYNTVFTLGGLNDVYQGKSFENITANLQVIYDLAKKSGASSVAITLPPTDYYSLYKPAFGDLTKKVNDWILNDAKADYKIDFYKMLVGVDGKQNLKLFGDDKLHATTEGQKLLTDAIVNKYSSELLSGIESDCGLNYSVKDLEAVFPKIAFMPIQEQAKYADRVCMNNVNNESMLRDLLTPQNPKNFNTTSIGNMAYIALHCKVPLAAAYAHGLLKLYVKYKNGTL
jgi:hypothetical protein